MAEPKFSHNFSGVEKWNNILSQYDYNLNKLQSVCTYKLPYSLLLEIQELLANSWNKYRPYIVQLKSFSELKKADDFLSLATDKLKKFQLEPLLKLSERTKDLAIPTILKNGKNRSEERLAADLDESKGFLDDIAPDTLIELSSRVMEDPKWKLLGDGLGLSARFCQSADSFLAILERLIAKNPKATVARLHLEAGLLKMNSICRYLDAIRLDGEPTIKLEPKIHNHFDREITIFDINRINEIAAKEGINILWESVASRVYYIEHATKENAIHSIIRKDNNKRLGNLNNLQDPKVKAIVQKFKKEMNNGFYVCKSSGGITFEQVKHLGYAQELLGAEDKKIHPQNFFPYWPSLMDLTSFEKATKNNMSERADFAGLLLYYWQNQGEKLTLSQFYDNVLSLLKEGGYKNDQLIEFFKKCYNEIKPLRSYDPELAAANLEAEAEAPQAPSFDEPVKPSAASTIEKAKEVAAPVIAAVAKMNEEDKDKCVVCMDKMGDVALLPCGHLGYCMDCALKILAQCPTCSNPIQGRLKTYRVSLA